MHVLIFSEVHHFLHLSYFYKFCLRDSLSLSLTHTHTHSDRILIDLFFLSGCRRFHCILLRSCNHISTVGCWSFICRKGLWTDWPRITFGCFWFGYNYGSESSWGTETVSLPLCTLPWFLKVTNFHVMKICALNFLLFVIFISFCLWQRP